MFRTLVTFIISIVAIGANAQVVINYNSHAPVTGVNNIYVSAGFINPGKSGKNNVWDFSNAELQDEKRHTFFEDAKIDESEKFNLNTTHILKEDDNYFYQQISPENYAITGFVNDDFIIYYNQPLVRMKYPFSYSDSFEGQLEAHAFNNNNNETIIDGNYTITADAYGKIILPGEKSFDVLRVCQHSNSVQVSRCREVNIESTKYLWYSATERYPIATTIIQKKLFCNGDVHKTEETWINQNYIKIDKTPEQNSIANNYFDAHIFPNPFVDEAELMISINNASNVEISISSITGKNLKTLQKRIELESGQYFYKINSSELSLMPGMYFVNIRVDDKIESLKLIKK
jgi:hypothetical protein